MHLLCFIIFQISAFAASVTIPIKVEQFHKPFWKEKPQVYQKIKNENAILVSAFTDKIQDEPILYQMKVVGGGAVNVPSNDTFKIIVQFEDLKKVSSHFREVKYEKDKNRLYLHMEALGYHARMHFNLIEKPAERQLHWECVEGTFKGMKGVVVLEELENNRTEISMTSDYQASSLPLPRVLMGLGLEIIGRQVAVQMKDFIEKKYSGNIAGDIR